MKANCVLDLIIYMLQTRGGGGEKFSIIAFSWMEFTGLFTGHTKQCHIPHILCLEVKYWPCLKIHLGL